MDHLSIVASFALLAESAETAAAIDTRLCPVPSYEAFDAPFKSLAVFGDSFSDVGNIHRVSNGTQPGVWSYDGRYSDGRVWLEYITQYLGLPDVTPSSEGGRNYAYGGATTDSDYIPSESTYFNGPVPGAEEQVRSYLSDLQNDGGHSFLSDVLHILFFGYNDYWWYVYRNYTTSEGQELNFTKVYTTVAKEVVDNAQQLYDAGAKKLLIGNVMNMSTWAEASLQTQDVLDAYDILVSGHNNALSDLLSDFEAANPDATVYRFEVFDTYECLNEGEDFLGFLNVKDPCHPSQSDDCGDIFSYKFWDYYHPTTHSHWYASTSALQSIYDKEKEMKSNTIQEQYARMSLRRNV